MSSKTQELSEDKQAEILHKMIEMVTRQTDYTYDEAKEHLESNNWDYNIVLRKYMGIPEKKEDNNYSKSRNIQTDKKANGYCR